VPNIDSPLRRFVHKLSSLFLRFPLVNGIQYLWVPAVPFEEISGDPEGVSEAEGVLEGNTPERLVLLLALATTTELLVPVTLELAPTTELLDLVTPELAPTTLLDLVTLLLAPAAALLDPVPVGLAPTLRDGSGFKAAGTGTPG